MASKYLQTHSSISCVSDGPLVAAIKSNKGQLYFNEAASALATLTRIIQSGGRNGTWRGSLNSDEDRPVG